jgi:hypothetical protein
MQLSATEMRLARADAFVHCTGAQPAMLRDVLFARADARRARPAGAVGNRLRSAFDSRFHA